MFGCTQQKTSGYNECSKIKYTSRSLAWIIHLLLYTEYEQHGAKVIGTTVRGDLKFLKYAYNVIVQAITFTQSNNSKPMVARFVVASTEGTWQSS